MYSLCSLLLVLAYAHGQVLNAGVGSDLEMVLANTFDYIIG